jgi:pyruvate/2-oxoglutarate dehydrogenase complex dihydrolipoamide acyltransferase (E2) component
MTDICVPANLWDDGRDAAMSVWLYGEGDQVEAGSVIAEIMVEKTSYELLAPAAGRLGILVPADEIVAKGQVVGRID